VTFSIVAVMGDAYGVAVASKFLSAGAVVPAVQQGVGAVASQAMAKVSYKADVLRLLHRGTSAAEAVAAVTSADAESAHRQLGVVAAGSQATFTGDACLPWAGGVSGADDGGRYAVQGNMLVGPDVVDAAQRAWLANPQLGFTDRLLGALLAADDAGGDARGRQSAAVYAVQPGKGYDGSGVLMDLRVDDHPDASRELARLAQVHDLTFGAPEDVQPLEGDLAAEVSSHLERLGYPGTDPALALAAWAGVENYEMRLSPDGIDRKLIEVLRRATSGGGVHADDTESGSGIQVDRTAAEQMWRAFRAANPDAATGPEPPCVEYFGDSAELADELVAFVVDGPKRATAGLVADYVAEEEPLPRVGSHWIACDGAGVPRAVIRTTELRIGPLSSVDEKFAWDEGEHERTLESWLSSHRRYFRKSCERLGVEFSDDIEVVFERFAVVWPPELADRG
jgi:uncharacterized Ntn-hydrolase superfamily protein/uncharacterized protein YhfF